MSTAEPAPPTDGLREEIARAMFESDYGGTGFRWEDQADAPDCGPHYYRRHADAVLALPGVRRLIAAEEAVARVRKLIDAWLVSSADDDRDTLNAIHRALDGDR